MKLDRLAYEPGLLLGFYEQALTSLGALCERTWHDRLQVVAEGAPARLWNAEGVLHEVELQFTTADVTAAREAAREVFPGCQLTFRLAETLRPVPLPLDRLVLARDTQAGPPEPFVAEKLWRAQFGDTTRWGLAAPFQPGFRFSLVTLVRCEIQAIDQHWSLRRLALTLPEGEPDEALARSFGFVEVDQRGGGNVDWPAPDPTRWQGFLRAALEQELAHDLAAIRARQEHGLQRELDRIDEYFANYERELTSRAARSTSENSKLKTAERLAAAKVEHSRRRTDQVNRHEVRVHPYLDALVLVAEPAWRAVLQLEREHRPERVEAVFVPRARRWFPVNPP